MSVRRIGWWANLVFMDSLLLVGFATASPEPFRIDLRDADPERIEELPGILEPEVDLLLSASGPGPDGLCERLRATGIPPGRLRSWVPYLDLPARPRVWVDTRIRNTIERDSYGRLRSELKIGLSRGPASARWKGERTRRPGERFGFQHREAIVSVSSWRRFSLWAGTLTAGILGQDPWRDAVDNSGAGTSSVPRVQVRSAQSASGIACTYGSLTVAGWRSKSTGRGGLVALTATRAKLWYGGRAAEGWGFGGEFEFQRVRIGAGASRSESGNRCYSIRLWPQDRAADLSLAWRPDRGGPDGKLRLEAGANRAIQQWQITSRLALIRSATTRALVYRGAVRLAVRGSNRLSFGFNWDERVTRAQISRSQSFGSTKLELGLRSLLAVGEPSWSASGSVRRELGLSVFELSILARRGNGYAWSGVDANAPIAGRSILRSRRRWAELEIRLLIPVRSIEPARFGRPAWRLRIEPKLGRGRSEHPLFRHLDVRGQETTGYRPRRARRSSGSPSRVPDSDSR